MVEQISGFDMTHVQDEAAKATAPLQAAWRKAWFDLPLAMTAASLRFAGQRLQAQGDFIASLTTCRSVPEVMEAQSHFVRTTVNDYGAETSKIMNDVREKLNKAA